MYIVFQRLSHHTVLLRGDQDGRALVLERARGEDFELPGPVRRRRLLCVERGVLLGRGGACERLDQLLHWVDAFLRRQVDSLSTAIKVSCQLQDLPRWQFSSRSMKRDLPWLSSW